MIVTMNGTLSTAEPSLIGVLLTNCAEGLSNPVGRQELLQWIQGHAEGPSVRCECNELVDSLILSLQDKMAVVRTLAEQVLVALLSKSLISKRELERATQDLAPATKRSLQAPLDRMLLSYGTKRISAAAVAGTAGSNNQSSVPVISESDPIAPTAAVLETKQPPVVTSVKAFSKPVSNVVEDSGHSSVEAGALKKTNKAKRNEEFYKLTWPQPPEDIGENEIAVLKRDWEPYLSADMLTLLFPQCKFGAPSQELVTNGAGELINLLQQQPQQALSHSDFILRWATYGLCLRETSVGLLKVIQLITAVFEAHRSNGNLTLHDSEATIVLHHLLDRSGHKSERHRMAFKSALLIASEITAPPKMCSILIAELSSKNKKSRVVCLEELERIVSIHGYNAIGKSGIKELGAASDSKDNDVAIRSAALDVAYALYCFCGNDLSKLLRLYGDSAEKTRVAIEQRIKERSRSGLAASAGAAALPPVPPTKVELSLGQTAVTAVSTASTVDQSPPRKTVHQAALANSPAVAPASVKKSIMGGRSSAQAFSLDITPQSEGVTADVRGVVDAKVSLWGSSQDQGNVAMEIAGIYADITSKVSTMTELYSAYISNSSLVSADAVNTACDDCREYLKMLHSLVSGGWSTDGRAPTASDEAALLANCNNLVILISRCVSLSLEGPGPTGRSILAFPVATALGIDVSLISVALATLHAFVRHHGVVKNLSSVALQELLISSVLAISNPKLTETLRSTGQKTAALEACEQIQRVLLVILSKTAEEAGTARITSVIIQTVFQCITEVDHSSVGDTVTSRRSLPAHCAKPLSKLLLKVLSDECKKSQPYHFSEGDINLLLNSLHKFFSGHPMQIPGNDTPFCAAKTVLAQLVKAIGAPSIMSALQQTLRISPSSFICRCDPVLNCIYDYILFSNEIFFLID